MKAHYTTGSTNGQVLWRTATHSPEEPGGKTREQKFYTTTLEKKKTKDKAVTGTRSNSFNSMPAAPTECVHTSHHCEGVDIDRNCPLEGKTNYECHRTNRGI